MDKKHGSFRSKMLLLFGLSMLLSGAVTFLLYKILQFYYKGVKMENPLAKVRRFIDYVGDFNFFLLVFIPIAVIFFYLLTRSYASYFDEISRGISRLASGDFNYRVQISTHDEFQSIADDINRASQKLQAAVERGDFAESSKDQLILNLAHDLRTPLTSVLGYLDFILRDAELSKEQVKHYTTIAYTKSRRLEKLIDELFEITRMNYGKLTLDKKPIDLGELLTQLNEEMYPVLEQANLTSRMDVAPDVQIEADGELLARVFENLLTNAIRYGKDGQYVDMHCSRQEDYAVVQVVNYGDCIPEDELPHLFEMFYTGDQARTQQSGSSGLGLFIAKNIVEQHQGTITAQSSMIRTVFEIRLPLSI
ncbi:HAMP domain-containing histidine kinase [Paenibacillus sp. N1-5-1-14]|uniref:sensor histidine kinase n=1 Tax=Paenibacillus radicibacter TaxID=2972488 RepID=UPI00215959CE|nr:HAMP domain-containing sensor histidine kinase [Paenibacillus radicibacter]MCR8642881.1 HAMP domain-containing histidine kinase [Paenibacillus radicibacter]